MKLLIAILVSLVFLVSCGEKVSHKVHISKEESNIEYYTCGMHPSVKVSPEEFNKGNVNCPICNMKLIPVYKEKAGEELAYYGCGMEGEEHVFRIQEIKGLENCPICGMPLRKLSGEEADTLRGVAGRIKLKSKEATLAGISVEQLKKRHLYKNIRTVGKVAYDPPLVIAQDEFVSALKALDKMKEGSILEIKERARNLVESSKRKLRLLGLSEKQIDELEIKREIQTSLILPEEKMWIYGDVYEYELGWVKVGTKVKVTASILPGEEFNGVISSINPVINPRTRSVTFRAQVDNPGLKLQPEMYVDIVIISMYMGKDGAHKVLAIPRNAVLDTGIRRIVWVDKGIGEYEGKLVEIGPEANSEVDGREEKFYPVLKGLSEGDSVVTKANFLIDSQTQLTGGGAAAAYGGALEGEEDTPPMPPGHRH